MTKHPATTGIFTPSNFFKDAFWVDEKVIFGKKEIFINFPNFSKLEFFFAFAKKLISGGTKFGTFTNIDRINKSSFI